MKEEYLEVLPQEFDEYTIDYNAHKQKELVKRILFFPSEWTTKQVCRFKDISLVIALQKVVGELFILDPIVLIIEKAILDDVEVLHFAKKQLGKIIVFKNCQIVQSDKNIDCEYFCQSGVFQNCHFEAKTQADGWLEFGSKVGNRAYGLLSLRYFEKHDEGEYARSLLDAMNIMDRNRKLGLTKIK